MKPKSYKAAHILVKAQFEAEDILRKLKEGSSFEDIARKFSSCRSAPNGGELGEIKMGKAAEEFEEAALKLKPGEISQKPVRTSFGYHLIKRL